MANAPLESDADRLAFLNTDEFGTTAQYRPGGTGEYEEIQGIFDEETVEIDADGTLINGIQTRFICRESDVPDRTRTSTPRTANEIIIDGTEYSIINWDTQCGITALHLARRDG